MAGAIRTSGAFRAIRATSRATTAPSELPTTTAGRCFLTSQNATLAITLKSSLSKEGMFKSGAITRKPSGSRAFWRAAALRPRGEEANP
jgi:hypothetical protein